MSERAETTWLTVTLPAPGLRPHSHDANQAQRLKSLVASGKTPQKIVLRARIILLAGEGVPNHAIAVRVGASRPTVLLWRSRFQRSGVPGLMKDARRPGRKKAVAPEVIQRVVEATLHTMPPAATHWSTRTMARAHGLSRTDERGHQGSSDLKSDILP